MPALRANRLSEASTSLRLLQIRPDDSGTLQPGHVRHLRMNLNFTEILAQLQLFLRAQILVAEEHHTPLRNEQRKLISLLVCEILELQANDFRANVCREVFDFFGGGEQSGLLGISAGAGVDVFAVFVADGVDVLEVERSRWAVLRA